VIGDARPIGGGGKREREKKIVRDIGKERGTLTKKRGGTGETNCPTVPSLRKLRGKGFTILRLRRGKKKEIVSGERGTTEKEKNPAVPEKRGKREKSIPLLFDKNKGRKGKAETVGKKK